MTVIDLREKLFNRRIEIIEITECCVYYAEELQLNDIDTVYIYCYYFSLQTENIISYFSFEDDTYLQHYYTCKESIIVLFENDGNRVWIVKKSINLNDSHIYFVIGNPKYLPIIFFNLFHKKTEKPKKTKIFLLKLC